MEFTPIPGGACCGESATTSYQIEGCAGGVPHVQVVTVAPSGVTVFWANLNTGAVTTTAPVGFTSGDCASAATGGVGTTDEFTATAGQTSFTLTATPLGEVWAFRNGARIPKAAVTVSGTTATYVPAANGGFALIAGDRITIDYVKAA